ncbi:MAG: GH116 family glycosyl-hydrolase [Terriglobia bacterium]
MNRRNFLRNTAVGISSLSAFTAACRESVHVPAGGTRSTEEANRNPVPYKGKEGPALFATNANGRDWVQFKAEGFSQPVCGVVYRRSDEVTHGMPLGGVSTGFLDIEIDGSLGFCTLFNSGVPTRGPINLPFLGMSVDGKTCVLTTRPVMGNETAQEMHYWGHYPVVDVEYETNAPVSVGVRAWTPLIPGDVTSSNIPAAVFEVHVRNLSQSSRKVTLAFSFPGPTQAEAQVSPTSSRKKGFIDWFPVSDPIANGSIHSIRKDISLPGFNGISVSAEKGPSYVMGVLGEKQTLRFGSSIGRPGYEFSSGQEWAKIAQALQPVVETDFGCTMAQDFTLNVGESKVIRMVLAWHSPIWKGEGDHYFARMYTRQFRDAVAVADFMAKNHESLLQRILMWQQTLYTANEIPIWLRESLVNILHLITKTGYWAVAQKPIGSWCREEDGLFGMNECPRECPQIECIPCSFYGNIPVVYFFPELALSTLRGYKAYQYPDGAAPWVFGGCTSGAAEGYRATDGTEMATPSPGYQTTLNGPCYVDMADRYWQRSGKDEFLKEFYPSIKKNTIYTMQLRSGPDGIASVPEGNRNPTQPKGKPGSGLDWFEGNGWYGMTPHVGGIHLAHLRIVQRMAEKMGDQAFVQQCQEWLKQGSTSIENKLWAGNYYLSYFEPESGKKSDLVFGFQLDGDWMCFYHGLPGVFQSDRAKTALETIRKTCMALAPYGAANFANADGTPAKSDQFMAEGWGLDYGSFGYFPPEVFMLAATYMYQGELQTGLELAKNCLYGISVKHGDTWNQPNIVSGQTGKVTYGSDYYQNMMLWILPAAIEKKDLSQACAQGSLVERMISAGKKA